MRRDLHLDISEIVAFGTRPRSEQCDETLRHLLKCPDCRSLLPLPTTKDLWRSVLEDRGPSQAEDTNESLFSLVASVSRLFSRTSSLPLLTRSTAVAAVLFLTIVGFSMLLMFERTAEKDDGTIAQVGEKFPAAVNSGETFMRSDLESASNPDMSTESQAEDVKPTKPPATKREPERKYKAGIMNRGLPGDHAIKSLNRSETRGSGTPCGENSTVGLEISAIESGVRINWGKVTGAMSYTLYLSDLDEKLIDQFESESETSYITIARLDPETTYKWKLVVTLKGGRTILATSRNFRLGDLKENEGGRNIVLRKKTAASVRCTEGRE